MSTASPTLIMAPLRGITDDAFRRAFTRHFGGFDRALSPFLTPMGRGGPRPAEIARAGRRAAEELLPTVPQLLTADGAELEAVALKLAKAGCREVNWNLGCPHKPVIRRGRGSGLLPHPRRVAAVVERVTSSSPIPLSIKMRLGLERPDEALALLERLEPYPLAEVTIHARLGVQAYEGSVDLDAFERCLEATRHPLVYNGDILDLEGFQALTERFPDVSRWMIGRGALANPFLPSEIKGLEVDDRVGRLRRFHDDLYDDARRRLSGPGHVLGRMKGIWFYLWPALGAPKALLKRLRKATTPERYEEVVNKALEASG